METDGEGTKLVQIQKLGGCMAGMEGCRWSSPAAHPSPHSVRDTPKD